MKRPLRFVCLGALLACLAVGCADTGTSEGSADANLLRAAQSGDVSLAEEALRAGADIETRDSDGRTALLMAATRDDVAMAELLVSRGADVNAVDDRDDTPFLVTGVTGSVPMLRALLPGAPNTRLRNRFGGVATIPAAERGHHAYIDAVLSLTDIDVDHVNDLGWTALLEAVILGDGGEDHVRTVQVLLRHGADPTIGDRNGVSPLDHARTRGFTRIVKLLSERSLVTSHRESSAHSRVARERPKRLSIRANRRHEGDESATDASQV